jgi:hypothetical protein
MFVHGVRLATADVAAAVIALGAPTLDDLRADLGDECSAESILDLCDAIG